MTKALAVGVTLATVVVGIPSAQTTAPQRDSNPVSSTVTAVLVDVVVRDRNGRPLLDLDAADFSLAENGVPHKVESFTRISRGAGIGVSVAWRTPNTTIIDGSPSSSPAAAAAEPPSAGEGATAIVFDQLSSESLRLAQNATLGYIPMSGEANVQVGVFSNESGIRVLQGFTTDRALIRRAVASVVPTGSTVGQQKAERTDDLQSRRRDLYAQDDPTAGATANTQALAQNASAIGQRETELRMIQTELNMIRAMEHLDREFRGYDTFLTLLGVVRTLSAYPGRKTIVFFSEGLPVSPVLSARLDSIIEAANRANVTTYAIDAQGLRTKSASSNMQKEVDAVAEDRLRQLSTGAERTDQPLMKEMERVEDTLRLDSRTGLARLAGDTGGILVEQSNDLSSAFKRIDEDSQFHYLLTYAPKNTVFDGAFRSIQVKVRRPGAQVFARKGYRAMRSPAAATQGSYEAPALALLDRGPLPNAFPVHAASFSFPDPARPGLTPVIVQLGTSRLRFQVNDRRASYAADAAIVVRVRDEQGHEVQKVSQQYLLAGDMKDLDAAKRGEILFYRELDLPIGVYTIESIVFDANAAAGSARVSTLAVPPPDPASLGMSSLVLVRRIEEVNDPPRPGEPSPPLYVGRSLLYPNIGEPITKSTDRELPFYFTLYGPREGVTARVQLLLNGRELADAPLALPASSGPKVQHVGRLPIASLPVGTYELRIHVAGGARELSRSAFFTIQE
jgi:VWFA-related protein